MLTSSVRPAVDYAGGTFGETFDELPSQSKSTWTNDVTLAGWYIYESSGSPRFPFAPDLDWSSLADYGQDLITYGATSPDHSLGSYSQGNDIALALVLRNRTTNSFDRFTLSYWGELWNLNAGFGRLEFSFGVFPNFSATGQNPNSVIPSTSDGTVGFYTGYLRRSAFDFESFKSQPMGAVDGHAPENRRQILGDQGYFCWPPGQYLILRWFDDDSQAGGEKQQPMGRKRSLLHSHGGQSGSDLLRRPPP